MKTEAGEDSVSCRSADGRRQTDSSPEYLAGFRAALDLATSNKEGESYPEAVGFWGQTAGWNNGVM